MAVVFHTETGLQGLPVSWWEIIDVRVCSRSIIENWKMLSVSSYCSHEHKQFNVILKLPLI